MDSDHGQIGQAPFAEAACIAVEGARILAGCSRPRPRYQGAQSLPSEKSKRPFTPPKRRKRPVVLD